MERVAEGDDISEESSSKSLLWSESFNPDFTHQLFGEEEVIYGYKDLQVKPAHHIRLDVS